MILFYYFVVIFSSGAVISKCVLAFVTIDGLDFCVELINVRYNNNNPLCTPTLQEIHLCKIIIPPPAAAVLFAKKHVQNVDEM